jgi:transposase
LVSVGIQSGRDQIVIAVDPHKASWTAAAVDASLQPLASIRVPVSREGYRALRRFARRWPNTGWAIEGAAGVGAPLTRRLRADDIEVIDVPAKLATRVRLLSVGHGRKNDDADAVSVGIAALTSPTLNTAETDAQTTALGALVDHRDDLVKTRTQTFNRLHVVLTHLVHGGAGRNLSADHAADLLRGLRAPPRRSAHWRWISSARCASSVAGSWQCGGRRFEPSTGEWMRAVRATKGKPAAQMRTEA